MEKVLLFGATGMAGHMVYYYLREMGGYDLANVVYRTPLTGDSLIVDVSDRNAVEEAVRQVKPDILINCVGVLVRGSKEHPDNAVLLNAYFPHLLEKLADRYDARLIHISTDCVFSGKKGNYSETDFRDADDVYGRSIGRDCQRQRPNHTHLYHRAGAEGGRRGAVSLAHVAAWYGERF